jgi:RHS repeat-associated protein
VQDNYANPSEPTAAMTFSQYGLTGYEVQYWDGSAWATVPGGSITNNDKVWRKFTFTPLTTTKIRVLTNASVDGYSRITEVEAWTPATSAPTAQINWLVADQLGTPRMVFDKSGSLETTKRHDYAPFGEELFNGLRPNVVGYGADSTRQKFTSKERDIETGLDYFGARYYRSTQGRFTSIDPGNAGAEVDRPQSWDGYSYSINNPLRYIDPDGLRYVQRTLANGKIEYGWCGTDECYNDAIDKNSKDYAGWTTVTFDENHPFEFITTGYGDEHTSRFRLNPNGTWGYVNDLDGLGSGLPTDWNAQFAIGGAIRSLFGLSSVAAEGIFGAFARQAAQQVTAESVASQISPKIYAQLEKQLAKDGRDSIYKALNSAERALTKHQAKLPELQYKSQVETTIANVQRQIATIKQFIKDKGL